MTSQGRGVWRSVLRVAGEFVVIVVSVLVALAGDAWFQDREVAQRQRAYLEMLATDLRADSLLMEESIALNEESASGSLELANVLLAADTWDELSPAVQPHFAVDDIRFQTGTLTALLATGDVNQVASDSLRAGLIGYAATIDWARSWIAQSNGAVWDNFGQYTLAEQVLYGREADRNLKRALPTMAPVEALRRFDLNILNQYPEIRAAFRRHAVALQNRNYVISQARSSAVSLLRLLRSDIDAR